MKNFTDVEWKVMEVLWDKSCVLGEIVDALQMNRNTVHTYLTRMEKKGYVHIDRSIEPHLYHAAISKEQSTKTERELLLNKVYQGSVSDLICAFLKESKITKEEKERLSQLLDEMEV